MYCQHDRRVFHVITRNNLISPVESVIRRNICSFRNAVLQDFICLAVNFFYPSHWSKYLILDILLILQLKIIWEISLPHFSTNFTKTRLEAIVFYNLCDNSKYYWYITAFYFQNLYQLIWREFLYKCWISILFPNSFNQTLFLSEINFYLPKTYLYDFLRVLWFCIRNKLYWKVRILCFYRFLLYNWAMDCVNFVFV